VNTQIATILEKVSKYYKQYANMLMIFIFY